MILFKIFIYLCIFFITFHLLTKEYVNPYTLTMVFGKKGSGKTTFLVRTAQEHLLRGWRVYCTNPIVGCEWFNISDFGKISFPERSLILIDEVSLIWSNRDFKSFPKQVEAFFRLQRHYKLKVILFSQSFDVDKKIRDLCDELYLLKKFMRVWSICRRIDKRVTVSQPATDDDGNQKNGALVEDYRFSPFILPKAIQFIFIPHWVGFFNSFSDEMQLTQGQTMYIPYTGTQQKTLKFGGWLYEKIRNVPVKIKNKVSSIHRKEQNS